MAEVKNETIKVTIKSPGLRDIEETVEKSYSVKKVKKLAAQAVNLPENSNQMTLRVDGKQLVNDDQCFEEDVVVHLHHAIQLWIQMPSGDRITVLADPLDTILTVKNLIFLKAERRFPVGEQELRFHIHLLNDQLVLADYGIEDGFTLTMRRIPTREDKSEE